MQRRRLRLVELVLRLRRVEELAARAELAHAARQYLDLRGQASLLADDLTQIQAMAPRSIEDGAATTAGALARRDRERRDRGQAAAQARDRWHDSALRLDAALGVLDASRYRLAQAIERRRHGERQRTLARGVRREAR